MIDTSGIDKVAKMRATVKEELDHIPKDNSAQKMLRQVYWTRRMNSLGKKSTGNQSKEDVLRESIKSVKQSLPDFKPNYDKTVFNC
jgi:hypothetical protein